MWFQRDPSGVNSPHGTHQKYIQVTATGSTGLVMRLSLAPKLLHDLHKWRNNGYQMLVPIGVGGQISYQLSQQTSMATPWYVRNPNCWWINSPLLNDYLFVVWDAWLPHITTWCVQSSVRLYPARAANNMNWSHIKYCNVAGLNNITILFCNWYLIIYELIYIIHCLSKTYLLQS